MRETMQTALGARARRWLVPALVAGLLGAPGVASAAVYSYVEWSAADVANGTASGLITLPDQSTVKVSFAARTATGAPGTLYGAQINGQGTNYWTPSAPYISSEVENPPPDADILRLSGGNDDIYTVTLSEPIKDPIMAILSLGQNGLTITYNFDSPFTIVSQGAGYFGGSATALVQLPNDVLQGTEGHGTIQFLGTFSTFSWTVPKPEVWHGFTFGIRTTERLEPPDAGVIGAGGTGGGFGTGGTGGRGAGLGGAGGGAGIGGTAGSPGAGGSGGGAHALGGGGATASGGDGGRVANGGSAGSKAGAGGGPASANGGHGGRAPSVAGLVGGRFGSSPSGAAGNQGQEGGTGVTEPGQGGAAGAGARPTASGGGCSCGVGDDAALDLAALALVAAALALGRRRRSA